MVSGRYGSVPTIRRRPDFLHVQNNGRRAKAKHLVVLAAPMRESVPRLGITVSKKVGNAVVRNRVRRRIRELFRTGQAELLRERDTVVIAYPASAGASFQVLLADLTGALSRLEKKSRTEPSHRSK